MRKKIEITPKDFNGLLERLAPDAEEAGKKYEQIRAGLIKYFYYRGALDPEALADETINRVAVKLSAAATDANFLVASYFYSFAANIYLEDYRKRKKILAIEEEQLERLKTVGDEPAEPDRPDLRCMEKCLAGCAPHERVLLLKYYGAAKDVRTAERRRLATGHNVSIEGLHTKVSRLRKELRECLRKCLGGK